MRNPIRFRAIHFGLKSILTYCILLGFVDILIVRRQLIECYQPLNTSVSNIALLSLNR